MVRIALLICLGLLASPSHGSAADKPLRIGYTPTALQAQALHLRCTKSLEKALKSEIEWVELRPGRMPLEGVISGSLDAAYVSPGAVLSALEKASQNPFVIVAGAAAGGSALIVNPQAKIISDKDFSKKRIAIAQPGSGPDLSARRWFSSHGYTFDDSNSGLSLVTLSHPDILSQFASNSIDGAWVSEPFLSRLEEKGGTLLVEDKDVWPAKSVPAASLVVSVKLQKGSPKTVVSLLEAHIAATQALNGEQAHALETINTCLKQLPTETSGETLTPASLKHVELTWDPLVTTYRAMAEAQDSKGVQKKQAKLDRSLSISTLNDALSRLGQPKVQN